MNLSSKDLWLLIITLTIAFLASTFLAIFASLLASILGIFLVLFSVFAYRFPRTSLWLFLVYLPLTGTIAYSFIPVYQAVGSEVTFTNLYPVVHLAKDLFYFPALLAILISSSLLKEFRQQQKLVFIGCFVLLGTCLLTLLGVNLPQELANSIPGKPFLMGIMGLKIMVGYVPFLACGYYLIRDRRDLTFFLRFQLVIIAVCSGLCLIQYLLLSSGICLGSMDLAHPASTRASLQARCFVGGSLLYNPDKNLISLPGTFNSPWQWSWFLIYGSFFSLATWFTESVKSWKIVSLITVGLVLAAAIISGQTTATLLVPIIYLVLIFATERNHKKLSLKLIFAGLLLFFIANNFGIFGSALDSIIARWQYTPPQDFIVSQFKWISNNGLNFLGHGIGRAASAARKLGKITLIETFYPRLLYEIGILGTTIFLGFVSLLSWQTWQVYTNLKQTKLWRLGLCWWLFIVLISYNTYYYPLIIEPVAIYYWLISGIFLKLPHLENQAGKDYLET